MQFMISRKAIFIIATILYGKVLHAQDPPPFVPGIYLSVEEFLTNSPSRKDTFKVVEETEMTVARMKETGTRMVKGTQQSLRIYRLKDKNGKNIKGFRDFWGFCDGYGVYVNSTTHTKADHFVKLELLGPICYFYQLGNESGLTKKNPHDEAAMSRLYPQYEPKLYYMEQYIIDRRNGKISKLTKKMLLEIVSAHNDLVEQAGKMHKQEIFFDIVRMYNYK